MTSGVEQTTRAAGAARIVLGPIGNPLPLGFLALAGGVALILMAFVFPLQLLASVFG